MFAFIHVLLSFLQGHESQSEAGEGTVSVFLKRVQVLQIVLTLDTNLYFCVLQDLSAAGYHVLSLDYRGEMRRDVLNTTLIF